MLGGGADPASQRSIQQTGCLRPTRAS